MKRGDRATYNGYEVCLFPLDILHVTRVHTDGTAVDYIGTTVNYPMYAPFSGRIYYYNSGDNTIWFHSDREVYTPNGLTYVTVGFTHSDLLTPNHSVGTHYNQGEYIYNTGQSGLAFGDHVHIDQSPNYLAGNPSTSTWYTNLSVYPQHIFYLTGEETIVNTGGINFEEWDGTITQSNFKWWMTRLLLERRKYGL